MLRHELDCAAVMKSVGKFYQNNPDIIIESEKYPLEVFCLNAFLQCLVFIVENGLDFCETIHEGSDLVSEKVAEVSNSISRILDYIMQQCCHN